MWWGGGGMGAGRVKEGRIRTPPQGLAPTARSFCDRYKMTCEYTWPNHLLGSDRAAVSALLEQHGLQGDVAFGHSKLFIRSPRTLVTLEQSRACLIPIIVLLLQKVRRGWTAPREGVGGWAGESCVRYLGGGERWMCTTRSWGDVRYLGGAQAHFQVPGEPPLAGDKPTLKLT